MPWAWIWLEVKSNGQPRMRPDIPARMQRFRARKEQGRGCAIDKNLGFEDAGVQLQGVSTCRSRGFEGMNCCWVGRQGGRPKSPTRHEHYWNSSSSLEISLHKPNDGGWYGSDRYRRRSKGCSLNRRYFNLRTSLSSRACPSSFIGGITMVGWHSKVDGDESWHESSRRRVVRKSCSSSRDGEKKTSRICASEKVLRRKPSSAVEREEGSLQEQAT